MKPTLDFAYHYLIFFSMFFLLTPPKSIRFTERMNEIKIEKKQDISIARENTEEILHSELLFKF